MPSHHLLKKKKSHVHGTTEKSGFLRNDFLVAV